MQAADLRQTVRAAQAAHDLRRLAEDYPMALARLWRPHCTRWNLDTENTGIYRPTNDSTPTMERRGPCQKTRCR